jgi:hypothetical protein
MYNNMRYCEIPIKNPYYFSLEISFHRPGLANFNPREGHIISKDSSAGISLGSPVVAQRGVNIEDAQLQ